MTYINKYCADAGTANCPCPLAETGDCLICSRLAGSDVCDCRWTGVCIYNEFMQNDNVVRGRRHDVKVPVLKKIRYGSDLVVLVLQVSRGMALEAVRPGSFVFVNRVGASPYANVPVSVMKSDPAKGRLYLALKIIAGKTKMIAEADDFLMLRGVYRNGLLGGGIAGLFEDEKISEAKREGALHEEKGAARRRQRRKWLILTKGIGFAPAVNLLRWAGSRKDVDMLIDVDKVDEEVISDYLGEYLLQENVSARFGSMETAGRFKASDYDRVMIFASDYYIRTVTEQLDVPAGKLICSNNFHLCCGEGICGACGHVDSEGRFSKMCKCREAGK